ncbi:hypothetical protein ACWGJ9_08380 [Curtobacterium citreum]
MARLSKNEQDTLVGEMIDSFDGEYDEEQFEADYERLDARHQAQIDDAAKQFETNAVGAELDDD